MNRVTENLILDIDDTRNLFGHLDSNINYISKKFDVSIKNNEEGLSISGDEKMVLLCKKTIEFLVKDNPSEDLDRQKVSYIIEKVKSENKEILNDWLDYVICLNSKLKPIKPKTLGQKKYISAIEENIITFGIGPAGTGKTFLAIAMAAKALKNNSVSKIILTRPAVEAGENLGFLPGDLQEKIDPYLRPLYDSLYSILGYDNFLKLKEKGIIEVAPLAYMRGRTLDDAFIILDEAQNATNEQMKMFLTRLGFGSKAVVTGDVTQIDLPQGRQSGLMHSLKILENVKGIGMNFLDEKDVVRHELVQRIIKAYEKHEKKEFYKKEQKKASKK